MKAHLPITHIMTSQVITVEQDASLVDVEALMKQKHIRHLPVVHGKKVVGIVSLTDLQRLTFTASFADSEAETDEEVPILNMLTLNQVMVIILLPFKKTQPLAMRLIF